MMLTMCVESKRNQNEKDSDHPGETSAYADSVNMFKKGYVNGMDSTPSLDAYLRSSKNCLTDTANIRDVISLHKDIGNEIYIPIPGKAGMDVLLGKDLIRELGSYTLAELKYKRLIKTSLRRVQGKLNYNYKLSAEMVKDTIEIVSYYEFYDQKIKYETSVGYTFLVQFDSICLVKLVFAG